MAFENAATLPMGKGLARNPPGGSREEERSVSCDILEAARCQLLEAERSAAKQYWGLGGFRISPFLCPPEKLATITTLYEQACKTRRNSCSTAAVARTEMDDGTDIRPNPTYIWAPQLSRRRFLLGWRHTNNILQGGKRSGENPRSKTFPNDVSLGCKGPYPIENYRNLD